jgi:DNA replication ATP-dependent helicase Dna2
LPKTTADHAAPALALEQRLLRFLAREEDDERRNLAELLLQPIEQRVLEGECIEHAAFTGQDGGAWLFTVADNSSKFRAGDTLAVSDGHDFDAATPLVYSGYDARTRVLRLERDPYDRDGGPELEPGRDYCIDRRPLGLQGRLRDAVRAAFAVPQLAAVLAGEHAITRDEGRCQRARQRLADAGLNAAQIEAGALAIGTQSLALVQGPPGTGKTRLLAQVVAALCAAGCRIALCAFTHRAVDHALLAIRRAAPDLPLLKVGSTSGDSDSELRAARVQLADARRVRLPEKGALIAGTCFQLGKLPEREKFHYTVFDEAGQLPIPHALPGMLRAQRWLFFGDHQQLPPVVTAQHADRGVCASIFEHLQSRYGAVLLDTTYRMNDGVCRVVSDAFYGGLVHAAPSAAARRLPFVRGGRLDEVLDPEVAVAWLRIDHRQPGQRSSEEAHAVADVITDLVRQHGIAPKDIAVIAPFRAQVRAIRSALQHLDLALDDLVVDTVERIQGQEREVVVISLASGDPEAVGGRHHFFLSTHRLNVALSRARSKVVLIASGHVFASLPADAEALRVASRLKALRQRLPVFDLTQLYGAG